MQAMAGQALGILSQPACCHCWRMSSRPSFVSTQVLHPPPHERLESTCCWHRSRLQRRGAPLLVLRERGAVLCLDRRAGESRVRHPRVGAFDARAARHSLRGTENAAHLCPSPEGPCNTPGRRHRAPRGAAAAAIPAVLTIPEAPVGASGGGGARRAVRGRSAGRAGGARPPAWPEVPGARRRCLSCPPCLSSRPCCRHRRCPVLRPLRAHRSHRVPPRLPSCQPRPSCLRSRCTHAP